MLFVKRNEKTRISKKIYKKKYYKRIRLLNINLGMITSVSITRGCKDLVNDHNESKYLPYDTKKLIKVDDSYYNPMDEFDRPSHYLKIDSKELYENLSTNILNMEVKKPYRMVTSTIPERFLHTVDDNHKFMYPQEISNTEFEVNKDNTDRVFIPFIKRGVG